MDTNGNLSRTAAQTLDFLATYGPQTLFQSAQKAGDTLVKKGLAVVREDGKYELTEAGRSAR